MISYYPARPAWGAHHKVLRRVVQRIEFFCQTMNEPQLHTKTVNIDARRCKSCGLCVRACAHHSLRISSSRNRAGYFVVERVLPCVGCGLCVLTCPEPQCLSLSEA
ncbi:MAG: 4Fe-4S dicluster domain-containing protein [Bradymonadia bacterium]